MKTNFPKIISALIFLFSVVFVNAQTAEEYYKQSQDLLKQKKNELALATAEKAIGLDNKNPKYRIQQADCYKAMGNYQLAYDKITYGISLMPEEVSLLTYRANLLTNSSLFNEAKADIDKALQLCKVEDSLFWCELYYLSGTVRMFTKEFYNATRDFERAISFNKNNVDAYLQLSYTYILMEEFETSLAILLEVETKFPEMEIVYTNIGFSYIGLKQYDRAFTYFEKALKIDPNDAYCFNNMGECKYKMGDVDGALKLISKSLSIDSRNPYAYRNRALIYLDQGKTKKACSDIEKALEFRFTEKYGDEMVLLQKKHCY